MNSNLPQVTNTDSATRTKLFFDEYGQNPLEFLANEVEATFGFFQSKGFDKDAAQITGTIILKQAKLEGIPVFKLLDQLKALDGVKLTALVAEILNNNRPSSSALGIRSGSAEDQLKTRNIAA